MPTVVYTRSPRLQRERHTKRERPAEGDTATKYRQLWPHRVFHPLVPIHFRTPPQMATAVTQKFLYHLVRRALLTWQIPCVFYSHRTEAASVLCALVSSVMFHPYPHLLPACPRLLFFDTPVERRSIPGIWRTVTVKSFGPVVSELEGRLPANLRSSFHFLILICKATKWKRLPEAKNGPFVLSRRWDFDL